MQVLQAGFERDVDFTFRALSNLAAAISDDEEDSIEIQSDGT